MDAITLGPVLLPVAPLRLLGSAAAALGAGLVLTRKPARAGLEARLLLALVLGLSAARLGFVLCHAEAYLAHPWHVMNLRDGGWLAWPGLLLAGLVLLYSLRRQALRRGLLVAAAVFALLWGGSLLALAAWSPPARSLPAIVLTGPDGEVVDFAALRGQPVVLNFWASWCPSCRRELPLLAETARRRQGLRVLLVNQGEPLETVRAHLAASGLELPEVLLDPTMALAEHFALRGYPTSVLIDAEGREIDRRIGELGAATLEAWAAQVGQARGCVLCGR